MLKLGLFSAMTVLLCSCHLKPDKKTYHLVHASVYAITTDTSLPAKRKDLMADTSYIEYIFKGYDLVNIKTMDSTIMVRLQYADTNNFLNMNLYDGLQKAYFTCDLATRLCAAQYYLRQADPGLSLVVLDASRPLHIQQMMWDSLKMQPVDKLFYLSNPELTSLHNYGCAVDATIYNTRTDEYLEMGTDFDVFNKLSQPFYEIGFLRSGALSQKAYLNRLLLRKVMKRSGLKPISSEWWHFSLCTKEEAARKYSLIR